MKRAHKAQHRASKQPRRKPAATSALPPARSQRSPMYGDIPLLPVAYVDLQGQERIHYQFDPDYAPPLPKGALRGDIRKQQYCPICDEPRYFYLDDPRTCVQCAQPFVFRAVEQKLWYETLGFRLSAVATRCLPCRRKRRSGLALQRQLAAAKERAQREPDRPTVQLALAEAIVRHHQRHGSGPLSEAIAASRRARRQLRGHAPRERRESLFWEGMAQALANRAQLARETLEAFVADSGGSGKHLHALLKEARAWLERGA